MQEHNHSVQIDNRKNVTVTGVESVKAFSKTKIELSLAMEKTTLLLNGNDFKITGFSKESGTFRASGEVEYLKYAKPIVSRLFR